MLRFNYPVTKRPHCQPIANNSAKFLGGLPTLQTNQDTGAEILQIETRMLA